jgi:hypothetical protein
MLDSETLNVSKEIILSFFSESEDAHLKVL